MKALIHKETGWVAQVAEEEFPVHPDFEWRTCPNDVEGGFASYDAVKKTFTKQATKPTAAESLSFKTAVEAKL